MELAYDSLTKHVNVTVNNTVANNGFPGRQTDRKGVIPPITKVLKTWRCIEK